MLGISCYQPLKEKANNSKEPDTTTAVEDKNKESAEKEDVAAKDGSNENVDGGQEEETSKTGTGSPTEGKVLCMLSIVCAYCFHGNLSLRVLLPW